jgi:hypothetical protein
MGFAELLRTLKPTKALINWIIWGAFAAVAAVYGYFQAREVFLDRVKKIENIQEVQDKRLENLEEFNKQIPLLLDNQTTKIINHVDSRHQETRDVLRLMIKHRDLDKELLIDILSLSRQPIVLEQQVTEPGWDSLRIGIRKK